MKSRKPHSLPRQHSEDELQLIRVIIRKDGKAEIYARLTKRDYRRSYGSLCVSITKIKSTVAVKDLKTRNTRPHKEIKGQCHGHKMQVDIKYVPHKCIGFESRGIRYYQITAINEYSRKRVIRIVDEKSVNHTSFFSYYKVKDNLNFTISVL